MNTELTKRPWGAVQINAKPRPARRLTEKREKYAQLLALGEMDSISAYCLAYGHTHEPGKLDPGCQSNSTHVRQETDIVLRIQELRKPVIRKLQRKLTYSLQDALRECEEMYDLAYAKGNEMAMGRAIELKGKYVKLLTEVVEHRHGFLDDATTDALLKMKEMLLSQREVKYVEGPTHSVDQKQVDAQIYVDIKPESPDPPMGPPGSIDQRDSTYR